LLAFHIMTKPAGAQCNLNCAYCYFLKKAQLYPSANQRMSDAVLESYTRQYITAQQVPLAAFAWQGGEPTLMGMEFFEKALAFQRKYAPPGMCIENTLQTNGTLLDDEWCTFLKHNDFLVGISLDGPQPLHDAYRKDKGGAGSFGRVMHGVELLKKYGVDYNILSCVHAANADYPLEVYRFLRDEVEAHYIQFIPVVEKDHKKGEQKGSKITDRSVTGKQYGDFLIQIYDEWLVQDIGRIFVQIFDVALGKWLRTPGGLCVFEDKCGQALALEHNGDLYACDHYVESGYKLGNILKHDLLNLVTSHRQRKFGLDKRESLPKYCLACDVLFSCNGGCPKDRIRHAPDGTYGLNFLCEGYQAFFKHISPSMRSMANSLRSGRPAAEVKKYPP
jgi:uncharacterized protein